MAITDLKEYAHLTAADTGKLLASGTSTCLIMGPS